MTEKPSPQLVQLTPPGRGAVSTVLVEGPGAGEIVDARFRAASGRPLTDYPAERLVLGTFGREPGEQVIVHRRSGRSVEVHCHGGTAAVERILEALSAAGGHPVGWRDWVATRGDDPIAAAAQVALADARTVRAAAILLDQYQGALREAIDRIEQLLRDEKAQAAEELIDTLLSHAALGAHLAKPWKVVIGGGANVGKSSLINALAGYTRAIVHPVAGTTRDLVTVETAVNGWPVELCDTAGLRRSNDALERAGIQRAEKQIARANLVVLVFDASLPWSEDDAALARAHPGALVVHNKCDLPAAGGRRVDGLATSALGQTGIDTLVSLIGKRLVPEPPPPGAAVPFTEEQIAELERLRDAASDS